MNPRAQQLNRQEGRHLYPQLGNCLEDWRRQYHKVLVPVAQEVTVILEVAVGAERAEGWLRPHSLEASLLEECQN